MNELKLFENEQFGIIRAIEKDGEPWFVAADVCRALDLEDTGRATARLDNDELTRIKIVSGGQGREVIAVNEPGLYSLVLGSRKPEAKTFKRWITHEVLPTLRRTGTYSVPHMMDRRGLTVDDYLRAAHITSNCRNERLPYVLGFLEQAGFSIPRLEANREQQGYDPELAYQYLCGWVAENAGHFHNGTGSGECYGRIEGDYAVILRPVFDKVCKEAGLINRIPNGGTRDAVEGRHLKQAGVKAGVPDLCLPAAKGKYHGLYLEMKTETGWPTAEQKWWGEQLVRQGYMWEVCYGWQSAVRALEWYLSLPALGSGRQ